MSSYDSEKSASEISISITPIPGNKYISRIPGISTHIPISPIRERSRYTPSPVLYPQSPRYQPSRIIFPNSPRLNAVPTTSYVPYPSLRSPVVPVIKALPYEIVHPSFSPSHYQIINSPSYRKMLRDQSVAGDDTKSTIDEETFTDIDTESVASISSPTQTLMEPEFVSIDKVPITERTAEFIQEVKEMKYYPMDSSIRDLLVTKTVYFLYHGYLTKYNADGHDKGNYSVKGKSILNFVNNAIKTTSTNETVTVHMLINNMTEHVKTPGVISHNCAFSARTSPYIDTDVGSDQMYLVITCDEHIPKLSVFKEGSDEGEYIFPNDVDLVVDSTVKDEETNTVQFRCRAVYNRPIEPLPVNVMKFILYLVKEEEKDSYDDYKRESLGCSILKHLLYRGIVFRATFPGKGPIFTTAVLETHDALLTLTNPYSNDPNDIKTYSEVLDNVFRNIGLSKDILIYPKYIV